MTSRECRKLIDEAVKELHRTQRRIDSLVFKAGQQADKIKSMTADYERIEAALIGAGKA